VRGFREPVIQVGAAPLGGQQLAKPAGLIVYPSWLLRRRDVSRERHGDTSARACEFTGTTHVFSGIIPEENSSYVVLLA